MAQVIDDTLLRMSKAANECYNLNANGDLTSEEQAIFYLYAENIVLLLTQMHAHYDNVNKHLSSDLDSTIKLNLIWDKVNDSLASLSDSVTSENLRSAVSATAYAIDYTASVIQAILNH